MRKKRSGLAVLATGLLAVIELLASGPLALGMGGPAATPRPTTAQLANDAGTQLMAAANAVAAAQDAFDAASSRLPQVQHEVDVAKGASVAAHSGQVKAVVAAQEAKSAVAGQQVRVAQGAARIVTMHGRVDSLARQAYMSGGSTAYEIEILLRSRDPEAFSLQLHALTRSARTNDKTLLDLANAQRAQSAELAALSAEQVTAQARQVDAERQAQLALAASHSASSAELAMTQLVAARHNQLLVVSQQRAQVAVLYRKLLIRQRAELAAAARAQRAADAARKKAAAQKQRGKPPIGGPKHPGKGRPPVPVFTGGGGFVSTIGTGRSARAAISWALARVGGGRDYHNQCLRFVDDAYSVSHGRTWTAIGQWNRALDAGYGHPGDRHPPIGAEVFWRTSNPARHIAIYAGAGMVISSDAASGAVGFVPLSDLDAWGPYVGWANPYYP